MIVFPNAKINLGLHVLRKRADGYHDISTVFYPVPFCDILEVVVSEKINANNHHDITHHILQNGKVVEFTTSGLPVEGPIESNLILKAVNLFDSRYEIPWNLKIHLHKVIPMGAGLGGGSSDAAFTLLVLNKISGFAIPMEEMMEMAAILGSDCSFFLVNKPVIATGRGEKMQPVPLSLKGYSIVIVKPPIHISTRSAFEGITPAEPVDELSSVILAPVSTWMEKLTNDFETGVFPLSNQLQQIKKQLVDNGALFASMTGSGSALYGIYTGRVPTTEMFKNCSYFSGNLE